MKLAIVGLGNIGRMHAQNLLAGKAPGVELAAIVESRPIPPGEFDVVPHFGKLAALIKADVADAVLVATPSFDHFPTAIAALKAGLHALVEKPIALHAADARILESAAKRTKCKIAVMLNQRLDNRYERIRDIVVSGKLGHVRRFSWAMTNWFRPDIYFTSSPWRGTWKGEAGGALLNQCIHNLDILAWLFGMPKRLRAYCAMGKYHKIEVEDEVNACMEFPNGISGSFVGSTGEHPGVNRLEIFGDRGTLLFNNDELVITTLKQSLQEYSATTTDPFGTPEFDRIRETLAPAPPRHSDIIRNFADYIATGAPPIGPARDGAQSVELANAMLYSTWTNRDVTFPLDAAAYKRALMRRIAKSHLRKPSVTVAPVTSMGKSFR
ncbi:MAG TPA: Gfo/Idh/MocA family oxidoreductase [Verrucomicrobiae bacterium]|nr:Gfo/Idh/MocA family oxidoreductase [Verrucomicrobiae bacterium]